jgi:hypothetical protein
VEIFARETLGLKPHRRLAQDQGFISFFRTPAFKHGAWNPEQKLIIYIKYPPILFKGEQNVL